MNNWLHKIADSDIERIKKNMERLERLGKKLHDLGYFAIASNSGGFQVLSELIDDQLVRGRPLLHDKLKSALIGENNQKIALDAPVRFQQILTEAEQIVEREIGKEKIKLRELDSE